METCKYGLGAGARKPTAEKPQGVLYRAYAWARAATSSRLSGSLPEAGISWRRRDS